MGVLVVVALAASLAVGQALSPASEAPRPKWRVFQLPRFSEAPGGRRGEAVRVELAPLLDRARRLARARLAGRDWSLGVGFDAAFQRRYILFSRGGALSVRRVLESERLRRGIDIEPEPGARYRLDVDVSVREPLSRTVVKLLPRPGTRGLADRVYTGDLLEALRREAFVFDAGGRELWLFYATDIDPGTARPAGTRTLVFVRPAGLLSAAWPVPEAALPLGAPVGVRLERLRLVLTLRPGGVLEITSAPAR